MRLPALDIPADQPRLRYPWLSPCVAATSPLNAGQKRALFGEDPQLDWAEAIYRLESIQGGAFLLQTLLVRALQQERLMRWVVLAARLEEVASQRAQSDALKLAERWMREGDDKLRYEAYREAEREEFSTPGAMAAMMAFVAGPSLAPEGAAKVAPGPNMARNVAGGVLASVAVSEALAVSGVRRVNHIGLELARGGDGRNAARSALAGDLA